VTACPVGASVCSASCALLFSEGRKVLRTEYIISIHSLIQFTIIMKNFWLPVLLASASVVSCGKEPAPAKPSDGTGTLLLAPAVNGNVTDIVTRANTPLTDFTGYTLTLDGDGTAEMPCPADGKVTGLVPGNYNVTLSNMTDGFVPAFDAPRYGGTKAATVAAGGETPVAIVLTQANAGMKFIYDPSLAAAGLDAMTATVTQGVDALRYEGANRNSIGHFAPGEVTLTLDNNGETVTIGGNANKKYTLAAKELWTITLKVSVAATGGMTVSAGIDVTVTDREDEVTVDAGNDNAVKSRVSIAALAGKTVTVTFTDDTAAAVKFNEAGEADIKGAAGQVIRSITPENGSPVLIGRTLGDAFTLKMENGAAVFRDADGEGRIPLGTRAEMDLLNNTGAAAILSGSYIQEGDIDLLFREGDNIVTTPYYWYGIGKSKSYCFTGTYDGGGYKLYGMATRNNGLFGYVKNATIKNVTLASGLIEGTDYVGGICGMAQGATTILNCVNHAKVSGARSTGGIVGESASSSSVVVSGCANYGDISASYTAVGGIVGFNANRVVNSVNYGTVSAGGWVGGIVGNSSGSVDTSANHGTITAHSSMNGMAGGICGRGYSIRITACYNTGEAGSANGAGGIVGTFYKTTTGQSTFLSACYNTGKINADSGNAGTIAGTQEDANSVIEACYWTAASGGTTDAVGSAADETIVETIEFGSNDWPEDADANWNAANWKSLGGWNGGSPVYPALVWE
jgi:hypothetical protein